MSETFNSRSRVALAITTFSVLFIALFITKLMERPFWRFHTAANRSRRAAFAVRDHVPAFQKWGTKLYTLAYLERYYQRAYYLTQFPGRDNHREFIDTLTAALRENEQVDIFLLSHGNSMVDWVSEIPAPLTAKLRMVYNTGCGNSSQHEDWLALGADTYIGHPGLEGQGALFYFFFLRRWTMDRRADEIIADGNHLIHNVITEEKYLPGLEDADTELMYEESEALCYGNCQIKLSD